MCKYSDAYDYKLSVLIPFSYLSSPRHKSSQLKLCKYQQKYHLYIRKTVVHFFLRSIFSYENKLFVLFPFASFEICLK
jgi:hypothetical protein